MSKNQEDSMGKNQEDSMGKNQEDSMSKNQEDNMRETQEDNPSEKREEKIKENQEENQRENRGNNQKASRGINQKATREENKEENKGSAGLRGFASFLCKGLVLLECLILALGTVTSFFSTLKVTKLSARYVPFFLLALLGVLFVALLIRFFRKKWTPLFGIVLIFVYLFTAGYGYYVCELNAGRLRRLTFFQDKEVVLNVEGEQYVWNGQTKYGSRDLVSMSEDRVASIQIGEETKSIALSSLYVRNGEEDRIYYQIYSGATGDYLVLQHN